MAEFIAIRGGKSAWGTRQGDAGEIYVVRLRIERAADLAEGK
jgi:hypothetical protein